MNKEHLKCLLISQFKQENAAIHAMMYEPSFGVYHKNYQLRDTLSIYHKDFGVTGIIKTLYEDNGKPRFEITFQDGVHPLSRPAGHKELIDKMSFPLMYKECISFQGKFIRFWVQRYYLHAIDYEFSLVDLAPLDLLRFDITTMKFGSELTNKSLIESKWSERRNTHEINYLTYRPEYDMRDKTIEFLMANNVDLTLADSLLNSLHVRWSTLNPYFTEMGNTVEEIYKLSHKLWYENQLRQQP